MRWAAGCWLVLTASLSAGASEVRFELTGPGRCPSRAALEMALTRELKGAEASFEGARLEMREEAQALTITLREGDEVYRRVVPLDAGACGDAAEAAAYLVRSWAMALPSVPGPKPVVSPRGVGSADTPEPPSGSGPLAQPARPPSSSAPAPTSPSPSPVGVAMPAAAPAALPHHLSLRLSGGGEIGGPGTPGGLGSGEAAAALDLRLSRRLHLALEGAYLSALGFPLAQGAVSVWRAAFSAGAAFDLASAGPVTFEGSLAARLELWGASGQSFQPSRTATVVAPGGSLGAAARLDLSRWGLSVYPFVAVRAIAVVPPTVILTGSAARASPSALWADASLGVGVWLW